MKYCYFLYFQNIFPYYYYYLLLLLFIIVIVFVFLVVFLFFYCYYFFNIIVVVVVVVVVIMLLTITRIVLTIFNNTLRGIVIWFVWFYSFSHSLSCPSHFPAFNMCSQP